MEDWALIANVLMTGATCFMAYATWLMARATKKSLEAQWKPYVAVYPRLRKDDSQALQLVIENIGSAPAESLKQILEFVHLVNDQVQAIAAASEQQSAASEEINRSVEQVAAISAETAQAMEQASGAVADLAKQSQALQQLIADMKNG